MMALSREHGHSMVKYVTSALNALVQPVSAMSLLVDANGESLSSAVVYCIDEGNVEFVGMFRQVVGAGHSCESQNTVLSCAIDIPAAPAPTTSTFFFPSLLLPPAIFVVGRIGSVSREDGIGNTPHLCNLLQRPPRPCICVHFHDMSVERMRHGI